MKDSRQRTIRNVMILLLAAGLLQPGWGGDDSRQPSKRSWLPAGGHDGMRLLACQYDGTNLVSARAFTNGVVEADGCRWTAEVREKGAELEVTFRLVKGEAKSAGVAVAFDFSDWTTNNYVLVPAVLYGGNRFRIIPIRYPPYIYNEKDRPLDMPITTTDILRLSQDGSPAKVEMMTGNCATPIMSFFNPGSKRGFVMLTDQGTRFGNSGLFVEEDPGARQTSFVVSAPCVRERRYKMCGFANSGDQAASWKSGDELTLKFRLYTFSCADLPAYFDTIFSVRKALSGPTTYRNIAPYSAIAEKILAHFDKDRWFENEKYGYFCMTRDNRSHYNNQIGWNGVPVYSFPAGISETPERVRRIGRSFDMLELAQGKSGLFYAMFQKGEIVGDNFRRARQHRSITMVRRTGETLYFGIKQLELLKSRNHPVKPEWEAMLRRAADALVKVYDEYGQFGQFVDADTGKMEINGSTAGSVNITALAVAARHFKEPRYMETAEKAGRMYYDRDLAHGYAGGGPAEILQSPDSESSYNLLESYVMLYELTGRPEWLERAKTAAALFSTWMVSYHYQFPKGSSQDRVGNDVTGSLFASSQNNCSTPGLYISSGDFLLKLFRATGDKRVAEMYKDTAHNVIQHVNTKTHRLMGAGNFMEEGHVTERVQLSDWEGRDSIGYVPRGGNVAWETLAVLTCLENPGIYINTDTRDLLVLDHVDAKVVDFSKQQGTVKLEIKNPTPYPACVSILAENEKQAQRPLGWNAFDGWPRVEVAAGQTVVCTVGPDGKVTTP